MVRICCATTDNTSKSMRLNSSKQDHAPHDAKPCEGNEIEIASNDVNSYVKKDLKGILKTAWLVKIVKRGKLTKTTATASYWGCHYQWTYPISTKKRIHDCPLLLIVQTEAAMKCEDCNPPSPPLPPTPNSNPLGFIGGISRPDNRYILCSQPKS